MSAKTIQYGYYVKEAVEGRRNRNESMREETISAIFDALDQLNEKVKFDEAFLFGSVTKPYAFNETSDIDVGFFNLRDEDFFFTISYLSERFGRDVDILQLESTVNLSKKILKKAIKWKRKK